MIYPLLAIFASSGFICKTVGSNKYLLIDFSEACPVSDASKPVFWKVVVIFLAYPVGIPVFFLWMLWRHEVPRLARVKKENLLFIEVLKEFKTRAERDKEREPVVRKIAHLLHEHSSHRNRLLISDNLTPSELESVLQFECV